jgi:hypothetical protein
LVNRSPVACHGNAEPCGAGLFFAAASRVAGARAWWTPFGRGWLARGTAWLLLASLGACSASGGARAATILFVGNSFTFGRGSPVMFYRNDSVTDLNGEGIGGVPALFKSFTDQAGLNYEVSLETHPGADLDWHLQHALPRIGARAWDAVVLQSLSTLDEGKPGDPTQLVAAVRRLAAVFRAQNAGVGMWLTATWPRADLTYVAGGAWYGKPIEAMAHDVRVGYDLAAAGTPGIRGVIPVGDAWIRAMHGGVADPNPYDGIAAGQLDLWTYDNYHASAYGYYLEALLVFGSVTGRDPRSLGGAECSGYELGFSVAQVGALQQVAFDELAAEQRPAEQRVAAPAGGVNPRPASHPSECRSPRNTPAR